MISFISFTKKEIFEQIKNFKLFILFTVFIFFGILSPVIAKVMPEIFASIDIGIDIKIPTPSIIDAYAQFFKNITQIGIITMVLLYSSNISNEFTKGTAVLMISKGLSRSIFIISKTFTNMLIVTCAYCLAVASCIIYTKILFGSFIMSNMFIAFFSLWIFLMFILALQSALSCFFLETYLSLLAIVVVFLGLLVMNTFPITAKFSPIMLGTVNLKLMTGLIDFSDISVTLVFTSILSVILIVLGIRRLKRREL